MIIRNLLDNLRGVQKRDVQLDMRLLDNMRAGSGNKSLAGVNVSIEGSLRSIAVSACIRLVSEALASASLVLYQKQGSVRSRADTHPLYNLLHDQANPLQTSFELREMMFASVLLWGNAFAEIEWSKDGYPVALWPMAADRVGVEMTGDRKVVYTYYSDDFGGVVLPGWRVHHLRGLAVRGLIGLSPIRLAMNAVGLGLVTEEYGSRWFSEGAHPSIVLSHPAKLTPEAMRNLRASFEQQWSGLSNAHRVAVVGEAVRPEAIGIAPDESQFLETRQFQVREIARLFRVPLHLLGETDSATYASAEQAWLNFLSLTLRPWAVRHQQAIGRDLLTEAETGHFYAKYILDALHTTDIQTRYNVWNIAKQSGILSTNDIREMEDLNPIEGGDIYWMPLNMAPADQVAAQAADQVGQLTDGAAKVVSITAKEMPLLTDSQAADTDGSPRTIMPLQLQPLIDDASKRITARVTADVRQLGAKALRQNGRAGLAEWVEERMAAWRTAADEMLAPIAAATEGSGIEAPTVGNAIDDAMRRAIAELLGGHDDSGN